MKSDSIVGLAIVVVGGLFLFRNLGILPKVTLNLIWPLILVGLGLLALYSSNKPTDQSEKEIDDREIRNNFLIKLIGIVISVIVMIIVGFVMIGVLAPVFLLLVLLIPFILFIVLGATFLPIVLPLLIPFVIFAAPIIFIIWLLSLLF